MFSDPQPIFVVGTNRSGTKWLSNILCDHPQVAGIQAERQRGILETNVFEAFPSRFDLRIPDNYIAFIELWAQTDLFRHTGLPKELFYELRQRPEDCLAAFQVLMNHYAQKRSCPFWLQKCDPQALEDCLRKFPNARFVIILRNFDETLRSTIQLNQREDNSETPLQAVVSYYYQLKMLERHQHHPQVLTVRYEDLRTETETTVRRICQHVGIEYGKAILRSRYRSNSSFEDSDPLALQRCARVIATLRPFAWVLRRTPFSVLQMAIRIKRRFVQRELPAFIPGTFGLIKERYGL